MLLKLNTTSKHLEMQYCLKNIYSLTLNMNIIENKYLTIENTNLENKDTQLYFQLFKDAENKFEIIDSIVIKVL